MNPTNRFWKFVFITLGATLIAIIGIIFILWQELTPQQNFVVLSILVDHFEYITFFILICSLVLFGGLEFIYVSYIKPIKKICAEASMIYASNPSHRIGLSGNKDILRLSRVINDFADLFENLNKSVTDQILTARKETEKERNLLAAIMAELPQGVIICNNSGRILLFNSLAKKIFTQDTHFEQSEHYMGLGRSIFHLIEKTLIIQAIEQIEEHLANNRLSVASYFIAPVPIDRLISIETIPVLDPDKAMTGFILTFEDVTNDINQYDETHDKLAIIQKNIFSHLDQMKKMIPAKTYLELKKTFDHLPHQYDQLTETLLDATIKTLPLTAIFVSDIRSTIQKRLDSLHDISIDIQGHTNNLRVLADSYSFTSAMVFLIKNLTEITKSPKLILSAHQDSNDIEFKILWQTSAIQKIDVKRLLKTKINALPSLFYVFKQNKIVCKFIGDKQTNCTQIKIIAKAKLSTTVSERRQPPIITGSRPEFYDFDLFKSEDENINLLDANLKNLTYTVFDTETTGLNPEGGDEIISIAAVRIVNKKIVYQDIFEELIDPKRDIPIESYKIHGINHEMLSGKKDINTILPKFKKYTSETVLVGHNVAFDMKMLKVKEKSTKIIFLNPVLDTLLLSAILYPVHEQHDMESIAKRLGVNIIGRHTALGDSIATAEIFLKLLSILESNGILTLKDAIKASQKTYYARLKY